MPQVKKNARLPSPRPRNSAKTRETILEAARALFGQRGYDGVGMREIAGSAGVNVALVNRYFGSKEDLFVEVIGNQFGLGALIEGDRAQFGERVARYVLSKDAGRRLDSVTALLISTSNPQAKNHFREQLETQFVEPLATWLGGRYAKVRAGLIASDLLGLLMMRDVAQLPSLKQADDALLIRFLAQSLQMRVDGK